MIAWISASGKYRLTIFWGHAGWRIGHGKRK